MRDSGLLMRLPNNYDITAVDNKEQNHDTDRQKNKRNNNELSEREFGED